VVTMGTPHRGTPLAWLGLPASLVAPSLRQLVPGSRLLRELGEGPWPAGVALTSLWTRRDRLAIWPSAVLDPGGRPDVRNVEVDCLHSEFLTRQRAFAALRAVLDGPDDRGAAGRARLRAVGDRAR